MRFYTRKIAPQRWQSRVSCLKLDGLFFHVGDSIGVVLGALGLVSSYLPDSSKGVVTYRMEVDNTQRVLDGLRRGGAGVFCLGSDSNVQLQAGSARGLVGPQAVQLTMSSASIDAVEWRQAYLGLLERWHLRVATTWLSQAELHTFHRYGDSGVKTQIDRVALSDNIKQHLHEF